MSTLTEDAKADPDFYALKRNLGDAARDQIDAENALYHAKQRLEAAAPAVCSTCLNLCHSVEFNYTFCRAIGDVGGRWQSLHSVAKLKDGKFVCTLFKAGGKLKGSP